MSQADPDTPRPSHWWDVVLAATFALFGFAFTTAPHWQQYARCGTLVRIVDFDELGFYLPAGARAYHEAPLRLLDPVSDTGDSYYTSLPSAPGIVIARLTGTSPLLLGFWWRALGGFVLGGTWFVFLRLFLNRWPAALAAVILLADPGTTNGQLGYALARRVAHFAQLPVGGLAMEAPYGVGASQCRILNPLLTWPWWLLFLGLVHQATQQPTARRIGAAGVACGILFYDYFFFWTTAGLALAGASLVDRQSARVYLATGVIGLALGSPALVHSYRFQEAHGRDWMQRTDKFVPVARTEELLLPKVTFGLAAIQWVWVLFCRRDLVWLTCAGSAGLLLLNQHVVTGLQIENFHWTLAYGPVLAVLTLLFVVDVAARWRRLTGPGGRFAATALAVAIASIGLWLWLTSWERCRDPVTIAPSVANFHQRSPDSSAPLPGFAIAGESDAVSLFAAEYNLRPLAGYAAELSPISDREFDERAALDAILRGRTRDEYEAARRAGLNMARWSPAARSEAVRRQRLAEMLVAWDVVAEHLDAYVERFRVRYLVLPPDQRGPGLLWERMETNRAWTLWFRK